MMVRATGNVGSVALACHAALQSGALQFSRELWSMKILQLQNVILHALFSNYSSSWEYCQSSQEILGPFLSLTFILLHPMLHEAEIDISLERIFELVCLHTMCWGPDIWSHHSPQWQFQCQALRHPSHALPKSVPALQPAVCGICWHQNVRHKQASYALKPFRSGIEGESARLTSWSPLRSVLRLDLGGWKPNFSLFLNEALRIFSYAHSIASLLASWCL